jgi:membrane-associated phospholipid phosphatase
LLARWPFDLARGSRRRLIKEVCLVATFAVIYEEIGQHMVQAGNAAASHAMLIVSAEQHLGLFREHAVQAAIIGSDTVTDTFNAYYGGTHFLIPAAVLIWLWLRHPAHYGRARTTLAVTTGLAFICFWLFPVAPPRLLPAHFGIIDTLVAPDGSGHIDSTLISTAGDRYASMPSLHVAWAVWCALALYPVVRHWALRALLVAYPLMTTLVVVATGNHYFLDVIAGTLLSCLTWAVVTRIGVWLAVRNATTGRADIGHHPSPPRQELPAPRAAGAAEALGVVGKPPVPRPFWGLPGRGAFGDLPVAGELPHTGELPRAGDLRPAGDLPSGRPSRELSDPRPFGPAPGPGPWPPGERPSPGRSAGG